MSNATRSSSPLHVIEAALRKTTERLACDIARPGGTTPEWNEFEWCIATAVASLHGISGILADTLKWAGPDYWQTYLAEQKAQSILREQRIDLLLHAIDALARANGIPIVALKGATLIRQNLYRPGQRPMGDLDFLVRPEHLSACAALLQQVGYEDAFTSQRHRVLAPAAKGPVVELGEHVNSPVKIELHEAIAEPLPFQPVDITDRVWPATASAGLNSYPSIASQMRHLLLHAAGNMRARAARLIQFHDIALLGRGMQEGDWLELIGDDMGVPSSWWMLPPLQLTASYYTGVVPPAVVATLEQHCSRTLRRAIKRHRLTDISWSQIRIQAFPGIEWSRSKIETLQFMKSRIWPNRKVLNELRQRAAEIPQFSRIPWYGQSHMTRIVRWIFSQPPRVQTMLSVRAACERAR
jgi:Uncharacterised nucleotidyltransferase